MSDHRPSVAVVGAGPAGLIAAETLASAGARVTVFERMPTTGRKLLMAGRGGLNLTHSEPFEAFVGRYGPAAERLRPMLEAFAPTDLVAWAEGLGQPTFVGSSGRVFPKALKASPLLRAWLARLAELGVEIRTRRDWLGWDAEGALRFRTEAGAIETVRPDATILALGGASWPGLGSNGAWAGVLAERGVPVQPFRPANSGFDVAWSPVFKDRFAGEPLKNVALSFGGRTVKGEAMLARYGIEGGAVYALSAPLRDAVERDGRAVLEIDLRPDLPLERLAERLSRPRAGQSLSNFLRKAAHLSPAAAGLLREAGEIPADPTELARRIKATPVVLSGVQSLDRAISSAGGIDFAAVDHELMLRALPDVYVAGEMLDWEAPTGGYLLQASFATGVWAARAALRNPRPSTSSG
ncbi:TIGR03862 family flavoprotein [Caulobacter sp. 17J80-11]|uniref:NAD(P)/FAD-dependent oxidoreductase n=1 Tax=Caulobacter sp. 17J80-11 TaxID=2763502 RepID=UPI001653A3B6|nr:TIGR03862 family flavoprotein [Caulobacter sp. 17J80-11]MBC6981887.1 TIGR03862 family flavoprotein [Caulobacter sp. 17J80-11]